MNTKLLVGLAFIAGAAGACAPEAAQTPVVAEVAQPAAPTREDMIAHGKYLVEAIGGCNDCHTPMTPTGPDMAQMLRGADLAFQPINPQPWAPRAPALAGLPESLMYDEAQVALLLETGEAADGSPPLPPMPHYRMTKTDAAAVAAYLSSLPPA